MDKNFADVADKAVDKLSSGVEAVARAVEKVAPHVWETAVRQSVAEGGTSLVLGLALLVFTWRATKWAWPAKSTRENYELPPREMVCIVVGGIALLLGGIGVCEVRDGALRLANPQYYAAMRIIEAAK
jgi:hypothetical protein